MNKNLKKETFFLTDDISSVIHEHKWLILVIVFYSVIAFIVHAQLLVNYKNILVIEVFNLSMLLVGLVLTFSAYAIYVMLFIQPQKLMRYLVKKLQIHCTRKKFLNCLPIVILFPLFASSFTIFKVAIPIIHPYAWDERLSQWDLILHIGVEPWRLLQPAFAYPLITLVLNFFYQLWFFIVYAIVYYLGFSSNNLKLRMQFLMSFVLSWIILGTVFATIFSSMGPCYYGYLFQDKNIYAPLMNYLNEANQHVPVWALNVQTMLLDGLNDKNQLYSLGISAMPSMHVATAVLLALWGWSIHQNLGIAFTVFTIIIMLGSIHLGWHYALDGYVGGIGSCAIWHGVGWMLRKSHLNNVTRPSSVNNSIIPSAS